MPIYRYERDDGTQFDWLQGLHEEPLSLCPETGLRCRKIMSAARMFIPYCHRPEAESMNARQRAYLDKPETQEKIKKGELVPASGSSQSFDDPEATSSITERARLGIPLGVG